MRERRSSAGISTASRIASAIASTSYGFTSSASRSSDEAPVNWLRMSAPSSSPRTEMNSLATRFMPSCSEVTMQKSAWR